MNVNLFNGDCLEVMKGFDENSIDSIVCDPPYGINFMGKKWDYQIPSVEIWKECLRVLKPGGHILVACGTKTQHRMAVNIEDAGFEIRDLIAWIYGSGFPKSLDIGKAIDKLQGNEREILSKKIMKSGGMGHIMKTNKEQGYRPSDYYEKTGNIIEKSKGSSEFEGYGTGLKPSMELWTLARKPLSEKTIVDNVLKYGTGGINIDGCRIGTEILPEQNAGQSKLGTFERSNMVTPERTGRFPANLIHDGSEEVLNEFNKYGVKKSGTDCIRKKVGNFIEHGGLGKIGDTQTTYGDSGSVARFFMECSDKKEKVKGTGGIWTKGNGIPCGEEYNDSGSVSRFFYCAKASSSERNEGLEGLPTETASELTGRKEGSKGMSGSEEYGNSTNPFSNSGSVIPRANSHPTVKPIELMKYLCRLITPKYGTVLDPFMGSGSTGIAANLEGFIFIGIEKEEKYFKIAKARINKQTKNYLL